MHTADTVATILLFVVLLGWVGLSVYAGAVSVLLSDSGAPGVAMAGVALAVVGIPASVTAVYVTAVVSAWRTEGYTFFYPLLALAAGTALAAAVAVKRAILLTDHPADASGGAAPGVPMGTPFVWIVGNRLDADGNLQVRLPGEGSDVVSVDARLLGVH